ncbi:MAG: hypothetical protein ACI4GD_02375 [Lachnospiraceae bacterium]
MSEKYIVEGYEFDNIEDANVAKKELEAVKYLSKKTSESTPQACLKIYDKIVEQNLFKTAIGLDFLHALEEYLLQNGLFDVPHVSEEDLEQAAMIEKSMQKVESVQEQHDESKKEEKTEISPCATEPVKKEKVKKEKIKKEKIKKEKVKKEIDEDTVLKRTKEKLVMSMLLNGILIICVLAMMYIASTSNNVNIINYETALKDKYATWAEDLKQKETQIKQRENDVAAREKAVEIRENALNETDEKETQPETEKENK